MKFAVSLVLTAFLAYVAPLFFPWWSFAVTSLIVAFAIPQKPLLSFVSGFFALFLFWGIYAALRDYNNAHLLSAKVAQILPLNGSYAALILITAVAGALVSGFAALTGALARKQSSNN